MIVDAMKSCPFNVNIDKCTSNNNQKVLSYFDEKFCLFLVQQVPEYGCSEYFNCV